MFTRTTSQLRTLRVLLDRHVGEVHELVVELVDLVSVVDRGEPGRRGGGLWNGGKAAGRWGGVPRPWEEGRGIRRCSTHRAKPCLYAYTLSGR